ncbi:hypothetical protein B0H10DRAFT_1941511 [Mycena sp. CBHHK59/15]|nr:hypothetical protein B0H10DRAFT_1941511 [Mycena sp. CBHHK59/15]
MRALFHFLALFFWFLGTQAVLVNVTIDDTKGDSLTGASVSYDPPDAWNSAASCNSPSCTAQPDPTRLVDETWHESQPRPLTSTQGSAVYVYCALSRSSVSPVGNSDMSFYIDGVLTGSFSQFAIGSAGFDYSVPVYSNPSIPPGVHTLMIQNGHVDGYKALLILDYIVYSYDDGKPAPASSGSDNASTPTSSGSASPATSTSASPAPRGASGTTLAVAGVLSFAVVLLVAGLIFFVYRRRRQRQRRRRYNRPLPEGSIRAFPPFVSPAPAPPPPVYASASAAPTDPWWTNRDQKRRDRIGTHRPYADLDPAQGSLQRPQMWERRA